MKFIIAKFSGGYKILEVSKFETVTVQWDETFNSEAYALDHIETSLRVKLEHLERNEFRVKPKSIARAK